MIEMLKLPSMLRQAHRQNAWSGRDEILFVEALETVVLYLSVYEPLFLKGVNLRFGSDVSSKCRHECH